MYSTSGCVREMRVLNYVKMVVSARSFSLSTYQSLSFVCLNFVFVSDISFTCQFPTFFPSLPFCVNFVRFVSTTSFHFNPVVSTRPCLLFSIFSLFVSTRFVSSQPRPCFNRAAFVLKFPFIVASSGLNMFVFATASNSDPIAISSKSAALPGQALRRQVFVPQLVGCILAGHGGMFPSSVFLCFCFYPHQLIRVGWGGAC